MRPLQDLDTPLTREIPPVPNRTYMNKRKVRILCLHGFRGNTTVMEYQLSGIRKAFEESPYDLDLVRINAPHTARGEPSSDILLNFGRECTYHEWFSYDFLGASYGGLEASMQFLNEYIATHGPFNAILGFSQGATMATLLTMRMIKACGEDPSLYRWHALILVCGVDPSLAYRPRKGSIDFPSLHIAGALDLVYWRSTVLFGFFKDDTTRRNWIQHAQGHQFPTPFYHKVYKEILEAMVKILGIK
ncbi:serine hydrolase FSH [Chytriomyces sp. MP71]|nr:serine hydrolase FSH [Chytriomyces sp. MP71]